MMDRNRRRNELVKTGGDFQVPPINSNQIVKWKMGEALRMYREVQILTNISNTCFKDVFLPTLLSTCSGVVSFSLFVTVKLYHELLAGLSIVTIFPMITADGIMAIFVLTSMAAKLHSSSIEFKSNCEQVLGWGSAAFMTRKLRSFSYLNVRMWNNYVDLETCLMILHMSVTNAASLLLASSE
jgi:hypothetical protein